jgi:hypothetical protein
MESLPKFQTSKKINQNTASLPYVILPISISQSLCKEITEIKTSLLPKMDKSPMKKLQLKPDKRFLDR